ncbi:MAG: DUF2835 family protein [Parashewanella sp.]
MVFQFKVSLTYDQFFEFYSGAVQRIQVTDTKRRVLHIHARHFRSYITRQGIDGFFEMKLNSNGELQYLTKLL